MTERERWPAVSAEAGYALCVGRGVDRGADALIAAATANIGDRRIDLGVGRLGVLLEQGRDRHDHSALAIAALRHIEIEPSLLHPVQLVVPRQRLDRGDGPVA